MQLGLMASANCATLRCWPNGLMHKCHFAWHGLPLPDGQFPRVLTCTAGEAPALVESAGRRAAIVGEGARAVRSRISSFSRWWMLAMLRPQDAPDGWTAPGAGRGGTTTGAGIAAGAGSTHSPTALHCSTRTCRHHAAAVRTPANRG